MRELFPALCQGDLWISDQFGNGRGMMKTSGVAKHEEQNCQSEGEKKENQKEIYMWRNAVLGIINTAFLCFMELCAPAFQSPGKCLWAGEDPNVRALSTACAQAASLWRWKSAKRLSPDNHSPAFYYLPRKVDLCSSLRYAACQVPHSCRGRW